MPSKLQLHFQTWKGGCGNEICKDATRVYCRGKVPCDILFCGEAPGESENVIGQPFVGPAGKLMDHIIERALRGVTAPERFVGDEEQLLAAIRDRPKDVAPHRAYADWLLERGRAEEAVYHASWAGNLKAEAPERDARTLTWAFTNLLCCIPRENYTDEETGITRIQKAAEPGFEEIENCAPRLIEFVKICRPRLIVAVGKHARDSLTPGYKASIKLPFAVPIVPVMHPAAILRAPVAQQGLFVQQAVVKIRQAAMEIV